MQLVTPPERQPANQAVHLFNPPIRKTAPHLKLWSDFNEICDFLHISIPQPIPRDNGNFQHLNFKCGERIYRCGQRFDALYLVYSGFLKTILYDEFGNEQVLSFPMCGDVLGLDSIHEQAHKFEVVALSDCNVIRIPFGALIDLSHHYQQIEYSIFEIISRELARQHIRLSMLGKPSAEARVAQFLVYLSDRFLALGYSRSEFHLRMTRNELGSYLGITLETVSRILSSLKESGVISVHQKRICLNDIKALKSRSSAGKASNSRIG
jgi:CRP/FNR family transcriptional regulator, anaerobic regulatory protein